MATSIIYPPTLPSPMAKPYSVSPVDNVARTQMEAGNTVSRVLFTVVPADVSLEFRFNIREMKIFAAWYEHTLNSGTNWFLMDLILTGEPESVEAKFVRQWRLTSAVGSERAVRAEVKTRSLPVLTADELAEAQAGFPMPDVALTSQVDIAHAMFEDEDYLYNIFAQAGDWWVERWSRVDMSMSRTLIHSGTPVPADLAALQALSYT